MPLPGRRVHIERIEREIVDFRDRATELLRREQMARARVSELAAACKPPATAQRRRGGAVRRARMTRALARARREAQRRADEREVFVEQGLRAIMLTLEEQSRRTRERLDRELERLAPVQADWERLREAFDALEAALGTPAIEAQAGQWRGALAIPEFPVQEREGYLKPFPHGALLF